MGTTAGRRGGGLHVAVKTQTSDSRFVPPPSREPRADDVFLVAVESVESAAAEGAADAEGPADGGADDAQEAIRQFEAALQTAQGARVEEAADPVAAGASTPCPPPTDRAAPSSPN